MHSYPHSPIRLSISMFHQLLRRRAFKEWLRILRSQRLTPQQERERDHKATKLQSANAQKRSFRLWRIFVTKHALPRKKKRLVASCTEFKSTFIPILPPSPLTMAIAITMNTFQISMLSMSWAGAGIYGSKGRYRHMRFWQNTKWPSCTSKTTFFVEHSCRCGVLQHSWRKRQ